MRAEIATRPRASLKRPAYTAYGLMGALMLTLPLWAASPKAAHRRVRHRRPAARVLLLSRHDQSAGDDPEVRAAVLHALGGLDGTAVVVNPNNGRVLSMVNQGLALSAQYQPCSTTKMAVALAALEHGVVNENTPVRISRRRSTNLTQALAYSINAYFEAVGRKLGFDTVSHFEREMGLGERAGWNIAGEDPGRVPDKPGPGGVAKLSSFGEGVYISPLQLAAIASTIANGGTLYYLQYPDSPEAVASFQPRIKRQLPIAQFTPEVKDGMLAAVQYGTARGAHLTDEQILGKTGTCSRDGTRFGLFASYLGIEHPRLVVVVILRGSWSFSGPLAARVAGVIYRDLDREHYFTEPHGVRPGLPAMSLLTAH